MYTSAEENFEKNFNLSKRTHILCYISSNKHFFIFIIFDRSSQNNARQYRVKQIPGVKPAERTTFRGNETAPALNKAKKGKRNREIEIYIPRTNAYGRA